MCMRVACARVILPQNNYPIFTSTRFGINLKPPILLRPLYCAWPSIKVDCNISSWPHPKTIINYISRIITFITCLFLIIPYICFIVSHSESLDTLAYLLKILFHDVLRAVRITGFRGSIIELFNTIYADQLICILVFLFYDGPSFLHITMSEIQDFKISWTRYN